MSTQANLDAQAKLADGVSRGQVDVVFDVFAAGVVDHDPAPGQPDGPGGFEAVFTTLRAAFDDLTIVADKVVTDDEHVAVAYTLSGIHNGEFMGVAATGKKVSARGVQIARFEQGQIVERWGSSDELGLLHQIGARIA